MKIDLFRKATCQYFQKNKSPLFIKALWLFSKKHVANYGEGDFPIF